jgi:NADPH:quinone reductase
MRELGVPKAMVVRDGSMQLEDLPAQPLGTAQVRVQLAAAGVNPVDIGNLRDPSWAGLSQPYVVGYEAAGSVVDAADDVRDLGEGDQVWLCLPVRGTPWGTYAEQVVAPAHLVAPKPAGLEPAVAAAIPLPGLTALQVVDRLRPVAGEWVLVHGASGGVGQLFVQMMRAHGVHVAALARRARHRTLDSLGLEVVIDRERPHPVDRARQAAGGDFAMVADFVGLDLLVSSLPATAPGGRMASIVAMVGDFDEAIDKNIDLHGVLLDPSRTQLNRLAAMIDTGQVIPRIGRSLRLNDASHAHELAEAGSVDGRIVLSIG